MGTLNLKNGINAKTAAICIGIGIKAINIPSATARETILRFVDRYSGGILYFFINSFSFLCLLVFLSVLLNIFDPILKMRNYTVNYVKISYTKGYFKMPT